MGGEMFSKPTGPVPASMIKTVKCDCGGQVFRVAGLVQVHYNALEPNQFSPAPVGYEFQCLACQKWAALEKTPAPGALPKWYFAEDRDAPKKPAPKPLELVQ